MQAWLVISDQQCSSDELLVVALLNEVHLLNSQIATLIPKHIYNSLLFLVLYD